MACVIFFLQSGEAGWWRVCYKWGLPNGRRFINCHVSLSDILPYLLSETYALVKKENYWKYIDRILYKSMVKITLNVC